MAIHATTDQVIEAIEQLTEGDWMRIQRWAAQIILETRHSPFSEPRDLINETLTRMLDRRRKWPLSIPFRVVVAKTMSSINNHETDKMDNKPFAHVDYEAWQAQRQELEFDEVWCSAEDSAMARQQRRIRVEALHAADLALENEGDTLAREVLRGMLDELSESEMAARIQAGPKQIEAAKRRIQRRLFGALGQSRAPY